MTRVLMGHPVEAENTTALASIEPMLVRASIATTTRTVGVLAHPSVLTGRTYAELKRRWTSGLTVIEPDCYSWSSLLHNDLSRHIDLDAAIGEMTRWETDVILIASTSFSVLKNRIEAVAGPMVRVLDVADYA